MANKFTARLVVNRDGSPPTYEIGAPLKIGLKVDQHCFFYILSVNEKKTVRLIYPVRNAVNNGARKGERIFIPPEKGKGFSVQDSEGLIKLWAVLTEEKVDIESQPIDQVISNLLRGGVSAESRYIVTS